MAKKTNVKAETATELKRERAELYVDLGAECDRRNRDSQACTDPAGDPVPFFVLRADQKGHIRALMAALGELPDHEAAAGLLKLREFDLYEEMHR